MLKTRLSRIEKTIRKALNNDHRVLFVNQDDEQNLMVISALDFEGTIEQGRALMKGYPNSVFIVDDIPHPKH